MNDNIEKKEGLSEAEEYFCNLFIMGGSEYAGKAEKCFEEAFDELPTNISLASRTLLLRPDINAKVKELSAIMQADVETTAVKMQIAETLKAVMDETATAKFEDKWGVELSPAPLRAVSVNAAKALMDLYPVKHVQEAKLKIEGSNGNVIFNVIVPDSNVNKDES